VAKAKEETLVSTRLRGKVAVVTGAGRGIGREYALALAREGAAVVVNDLAGADGSSPADAVVAELHKLGADAAADHADVTDPAAVEAMMARAAETFGGLDIVVANAGIVVPRSIEAMTGAEWAKVIDVHVNGTFNCVHAAAPLMRRRGGGSIITTGSLATELLFPGLASYRAAKAAIVVLTNYAAEEFRDAGINVNSIMPGATSTRMSDTFYSSLGDDREFLESAERRNQQNSGDGLPQAAPAATVPPLGVYLCTEAGRGITGRAFQLSGVRIGFVDTTSEFNFLTPADEAGWTAETLTEAIPPWLSSTLEIAS
jgi:NAD(P)-dependent dehydrogenase (short-subunit alcohol dehydrogenase family)